MLLRRLEKYVLLSVYKPKRIVCHNITIKTINAVLSIVAENTSFLILNKMIFIGIEIFF
jgi:hypothetical protein